MIYFDNAATTMQKPKEVVEAVTKALSSMGNAGRGAHVSSLDASRMIYDTRRKVAELFHGEDPAQVVFTANATESLNTAIKGLFSPGDHILTTQLEHNSVLRPLFELEEKGLELPFWKVMQKDVFRMKILKNTCKRIQKPLYALMDPMLQGICWI